MQRYVRLPLILVALAAGLAGLSAAQDAAGSYVQVRVTATDPAAVFWVDGSEFVASATFMWPEGSKHILEVRNAVQHPGDNPRVKLTWSAWQEAVTQTSSGDPKWVINASAKVTQYSAMFARMYYLCQSFRFQPERGELTVNGACMGTPGSCDPLTDATHWYPAGTVVKLQATPYPGFAFVNWAIPNQASSTSFITTLTIDRPMDGAIEAVFVDARRVTFRTSPPGLKVLVDRTEVLTRASDQAPCLIATNPVGYPDPSNPYPPIDPSGKTPTLPYYKCGANPLGGQVPLCNGDFDFIPGSKHILGAPEMQYVAGKPYIFDGWDAGGAQNRVFETPASGWQVLTARFVPAYTASFDSNLTGLKLMVDGRDNWTQTRFYWGLGATHTVTAPAEQVAPDGRRWRFVAWSDGAPRERTFKLDSMPPNDGFQVTATYEALGRLTVQTDPPGLPLEVAGTACRAPCTVERAAGEVVAVKAPASTLQTPENRQEFNGWDDGGDAARQVTMTTGIKTLTARYRTLYKLNVFLDPPDGVEVTTEPAAGDNWFAAATSVAVTARAKAGFRFRNWEGDLAGSVPSGTLQMTAPRAIAAHLDRVPHLPESAVENAAGPTPDAVVAPGSLIVINGKNIAQSTAAGPGNPLAQTLANVTVQGGGLLYPLASVTPDRIVALLPAATGIGTQQLTVAQTGQPPVTTSFQVARNAPGLIVNYAYATPVALAVRADWSRVAPANPPAVNETVSLYGTGFGPFTTALPDGFGAPAGMRLALADGVELLADGTPIPYLWCGAPTGLPGLVMIQFNVPPPAAGQTTVELRVRVGGRESNTVRLPVAAGEAKASTVEPGGDQ